VRCYTRSINYDPSNHILYANRAMGYIKLEALEKAEEDCSKALQLDCTYVKAWSRRGLTRFKRGKYSLVSVLRLLLFACHFIIFTESITALYISHHSSSFCCFFIETMSRHLQPLLRFQINFIATLTAVCNCHLPI
jgi:tetratricopeptide (TPR) repeat protein